MLPPSDRSTSSSRGIARQPRLEPGTALYKEILDDVPARLRCSTFEVAEPM